MINVKEENTESSRRNKKCSQYAPRSSQNQITNIVSQLIHYMIGTRAFEYILVSLASHLLS
jgi:hypothetical protein